MAAHLRSKTTASIVAAATGALLCSAALRIAMPEALAASPSASVCKPKGKQHLPHTTRAGKRIPALVTDDYLDVRVTLDRGTLRVSRVTQGKLAKKTLLPRFRGPFEVLLYTKGLLRDVLPFNFPLMLPAGERTPTNVKLDRAMAQGVTRATTVVRVPFEANLTHLVLHDTLRKRKLRYDLAQKSAGAGAAKAKKKGR